MSLSRFVSVFFKPKNEQLDFLVDKKLKLTEIENNLKRIEKKISLNILVQHLPAIQKLIHQHRRLKAEQSSLERTIEKLALHYENMPIYPKM